MDNRTAAKAEDNLVELASKNFELTTLLVEEVCKLRLENAGLRLRVAELEGVGEMWKKAEHVVAMIDRECSLCSPARTLADRVQTLIQEYEKNH